MAEKVIIKAISAVIRLFSNIDTSRCITSVRILEFYSFNIFTGSEKFKIVKL